MTIEHDTLEDGIGAKVIRPRSIKPKAKPQKLDEAKANKMISERRAHLKGIRKEMSERFPNRPWLHEENSALWNGNICED